MLHFRRLTTHLAALAGTLLTIGALASPATPIAVAETGDSTYTPDTDGANMAQNRIRVRTLGASGAQSLTFNVALRPAQTLVGATLISGTLSFTLSVGAAEGLPAPTCAGLPSTSVNSHALQLCTSTVEGVYPVTLTRADGEGKVVIFNAVNADAQRPSIEGRSLSSVCLAPTIEKRGVKVFQYGQAASGDENLRFRVRSASALAHGRLFNQRGELICTASGHVGQTNDCVVSTRNTAALYMVVLNTRADGNDEPVETLLRRDGQSVSASC